MKQRLYFDTSIFGGVFDEEFEEPTLQLFERLKLSQIICVYSSLTENELIKAPVMVRDYFKSLPKGNLEYIRVHTDAVSLAKQYIDAKVVGQTSFDDCVHIAMATIHQVDILVSWNFKHIVNVYRIRGYNDINLKNGYSQIEIRSPRELVDYGTK